MPRTSAGPARPLAAVVDLTARRAEREQALALAARAPVRHLPVALLRALQGSWGTPEELGLTEPPERHLRVVAG